MATDSSSPAARSARSVTYVWLALAALTVLGWWLAPSQPGAPAGASTGVTVAVLAVALVKSRLIIRYFMEVRTAPTWLQRSTDAWLVVLFGSILVIYLF